MSDKKLEEIHADVKEIKKDVAEIRIMDAVQNTQLAEHIRRTELAEARISKMESWYIKYIIPISAILGATIAKFVGVFK